MSYKSRFEWFENVKWWFEQQQLIILNAKKNESHNSKKWTLWIYLDIRPEWEWWWCRPDNDKDDVDVVDEVDYDDDDDGDADDECIDTCRRIICCVWSWLKRITAAITLANVY